MQNQPYLRTWTSDMLQRGTLFVSRSCLCTQHRQLLETNKVPRCNKGPYLFLGAVCALNTSGIILFVHIKSFLMKRLKFRLLKKKWFIRHFEVLHLHIPHFARVHWLFLNLFTSVKLLKICSCIALNCYNYSRKSSKMFRFPRNRKKERIWIINCRKKKLQNLTDLFGLVLINLF